MFSIEPRKHSAHKLILLSLTQKANDLAAKCILSSLTLAVVL